MHLASDSDIPSGMLGGVILGVSVSGYLLLTGKLTGISGIIENVVIADNESVWNWPYIAGLFSSGLILMVWKPEVFGAQTTLSNQTIIAAALITGFGTRLANGCTSGHGLCGLSRLSPRSLVAVLSFMGSGALTAYITRNTAVAELLKGSTADQSISNVQYDVTMTERIMFWLPTALSFAVSSAAFSYLYHGKYKAHKESLQKKEKEEGLKHSQMDRLTHHLATYTCSMLFGLGLGISGMTNPERVVRFLDFAGSAGFDPTLMGVMGCGVLLNLAAFSYFKSKEVQSLIPRECGTECLAKKIHMGMVPANMKVDWKLVSGSLLFGMGWGLTGLCPGPALVSLAASIKSAALFVPFMLGGMSIRELFIS